MVALRCMDLYKSFGQVQALAGLWIEFQPGVTAIVGPNGAGKTTLLNVLTGFLKPDRGRCLVGARDITGLSPDRIARMGIARTFQDLRLITQVSVLENVLLAMPPERGERLFWALFGGGRAASEDRAREEARNLLRSVGVEQKASSLAGEISYGQQKLLSLACCIASCASIVLLDEPVAGLDVVVASQVMNILRRLGSDGKVTVFIEHDISAVRCVADVVVVMDEGRIVAQGRPEEVLTRPEIAEVYLA